ncbi:MAG TPA: YidC/Oxa1 family membrane protein insertase [Solirubrobacteraceae bacterium]|jgi:YidC/Oxa1 family membrane protein insertase|nr:YidC/Oxa1 family membrane protein insertase [Solirubrobacteraceae bacterium]
MPFFLADVPVIQPLIDLFEKVLVFFHDSASLGWGTSIIALTVTIRALLLPLTLKQVRSMQEMQRIAPQMKELQAKYKDDRQRLNQEMMKLYQEHKVNPFASCLPLLAQLPVFISLFYLLRQDLRHEVCPDINPLNTANPKPCGASSASEFLFIPDITDAATGGVLAALIVLYVGSQLASSLLMSVSADPRQRYIFMALPFVFIPFIISFPAGLLVYWITTNVWTIVQQFIVRRTVGPVRPPELPAMGGGGGRGGGGGGGRGKDGGGPQPSGGRERTATGSKSGGNGSKPTRRSAPPPPPRRKKKKTGRRR